MYINKEIKIRNKNLWQIKPGPIKELIPLCRRLAAEGSVLLENNGVLPLKKGTKLAVFGRTQETYIKSGTGSGGLVRVENPPCIIESFRQSDDFEIDEELACIYKDWVSENPYDNGHGWATEPWSQKEMQLSDELIKRTADRNDAAVVIIGRTAGEDKDNSYTKGSYCLTDDEIDMIEKVTLNFKETVIILNVGNIIDLSFSDKYNISALLYVWQGGQEGANALVDVLSGKISPCGKLPDTQTFAPSDYPYFDNFGDKNECVYEEDIYVGYRYFETFAENKVRYPFGFGLTYTNFEIKYTAKEENGKIIIYATVKNAGYFPSKEVVQIYFGAPNGNLGKPAKQLIAYKKTKELLPGKSQNLEISFNISDMKSYDDSGVTGNEFCYVLEQGEYKIYAGTDVRHSTLIYSFINDKTEIVERWEQIMPPEKAFTRFVPKSDDNGKIVLGNENVPLRKFDLDERIKNRRPIETAFTGDKGIKLIDVADKKNTVNEFIAQMNDNDLIAICCGEGMNSPKVTVGTAGALGGVTDSLIDFGIPVCCVTDGPSGIRIGGDLKSTSLPNGYVFASSFDDDLTEQIFELIGIELFAYNIDAVLGPGINIHRHPLCGRNFEYFSEDPLLTGRIAAAQSRGVAKSGCTATIKHLCCNNQEYGRRGCDVVVSERALREIYLKGFEIAVKDGKIDAIMTSYNSVNGYLCASNYDLTTTVLRKEWKYDGFVMTDWWPICNCKGEKGNGENLKAMIRAHNDIYMVSPSVEVKSHNIFEGLNEGYITRGDLQYCCENLLKYILKSPAFKKFVDSGCKKPEFASINESDYETVSYSENIVSDKEYTFDYNPEKKCVLVFEIECSADSLAQYPIILRVGGKHAVSLSVNGNYKGSIIRKISLKDRDNVFGFELSDNVKIKKFIIKQ